MIWQLESQKGWIVTQFRKAKFYPDWPDQIFLFPVVDFVWEYVAILTQASQGHFRHSCVHILP